MRPYAVDTLKPDTTLLNTLSADPRYAYGEELQTPEGKSFFEWLMEKIDDFIRELFDTTSDETVNWVYVILAVAALLFIVYMIYKMRPNLFRRKSKKEKLDYNVEDDNIYAFDFEKEITEALARQDYWQAVRMTYLKTLRHLADADRIKWQIYKTPTQYVTEVNLEAFRLMTDRFVRVRYGGFHPTSADYDDMVGWYNNITGKEVNHEQP